MDTWATDYFASTRSKLAFDFSGVIDNAMQPNPLPHELAAQIDPQHIPMVAPMHHAVLSHVPSPIPMGTPQWASAANEIGNVTPPPANPPPGLGVLSPYARFANIPDSDPRVLGIARAYHIPVPGR